MHNVLYDFYLSKKNLQFLFYLGTASWT